MAKKEVPAYIESAPGFYTINPAYVKAQEEASKKEVEKEVKAAKTTKAKK